MQQLHYYTKNEILNKIFQVFNVTLLLFNFMFRVIAVGYYKQSGTKDYRASKASFARSIIFGVTPIVGFSMFDLRTSYISKV